jgi:hypothetical protein
MISSRLYEGIAKWYRRSRKVRECTLKYYIIGSSKNGLAPPTKHNLIKYQSHNLYFKRYSSNLRLQSKMAFKIFKKKSTKTTKVETSPLPPVEDKPVQAAEPESEEEAETPSDASEAASEEIPQEQEKESWMSKFTVNCCL